jgi:hypothetical protein
LFLIACLSVGGAVAAGCTSSPPKPASSHLEDEASVSHLNAAIEYHNKAADIGNKSTGIVSVMSPADWNAIYNYDQKALGEAEQANISDMNKHYPGFGDHFGNEFVEGLRLIVRSGPNSSDAPAFIRGQFLVHQFGDWFEAHEDAIRNS